MINKKADLEPSSIVDPRTKLKIRISTTVRIAYIETVYNDDRAGISNEEINDFIAKDFAASHNGAEHMFLSRTSNINTKKREWIEIRKAVSSRKFGYFFSIIGIESIDVIFVQEQYKRPRKKRKVIRNINE